MARIAVDAMGGDHAPHAIVRGALTACGEDPDLELLLVGQRETIEPLVADQADAKIAQRVRLVPASQVIGMDESPVEALRQKKDSSLAVLARLGAEREVDAVVSAGNTGAFAAACQVRMRPLPCIDRPGIAVTIPGFHGPFVLCDVGANIQAKPRHLFEYAVMASLYAREVLGIAEPRVGVLSVGEESEKGTRLVRSAHELIEADGRLRFVGNVEGRDLFCDRCDVAVCDGFVGNIVLKLIEGLAEGLFKVLAREVGEESDEARLRMQTALENVRRRHDYAEYGGAPLLGVDGVSIVCHGRSDATAIRNAVRAAKRFVASRFTDIVSARFATVGAQG